MEAWKKSQYFGRYKSNKKHDNVIGNASEGQGYADKRKRKIISRYKKLMRKTRISEANVVTDHPSMHHVPAADSKHSMDQTEENNKVKTTHYRKNEHRRNTKSVYTKEDKVKFQRRGSRKQSEGDQIKKGLNRYSDMERLRQKEVQDYHKQVQEKAARRKSREEALKKHRERKEATHKKLSKRTARGQPVIKYQMEYLLQKIQSQSP